MHTICNQLALCNPTLLQSACTQFAIHLITCDSNLLAIYLHYNLQSTCSFVPQFYLQSTCTQFTINLLFVTQLYLQSTCTQFAIHLLTCDSNLLAIYLHYNLQSTCSFVPQFYLQSTCTQFAINLFFVTLQLEVAFKLPAIYNQLALCSTTTSTGIQIACNLQSVALCLQLQLAYKLPAIHNTFVLCLQLPFRNSILGLASASCTMPPTGEL